MVCERRLSDNLERRHSERHDTASDAALQGGVHELKRRYMRNAGPLAKVITTVGDPAESGLSPPGSVGEPEPQDRVPLSGRSCGRDVEWQSEERTPYLTEPGQEPAEAEQEVCQLQP